MLLYFPRVYFHYTPPPSIAPESFAQLDVIHWEALFPLRPIGVIIPTSHTCFFFFCLPLSARCCQGDRAAGEAAGVGWRPRSQAPVSEESASERVLHSHQRGESLTGPWAAGPWSPRVTFSILLRLSVYYLFYLFFIFLFFSLPLDLSSAGSPRCCVLCGALPINHCAKVWDVSKMKLLIFHLFSCISCIRCHVHLETSEGFYVHFEEVLCI